MYIYKLLLLPVSFLLVGLRDSIQMFSDSCIVEHDPTLRCQAPNSLTGRCHNISVSRMKRAFPTEDHPTCFSESIFEDFTSIDHHIRTSSSFVASGPAGHPALLSHPAITASSLITFDIIRITTELARLTEWLPTTSPALGRNFLLWTSHKSTLTMLVVPKPTKMQ